MDSSRGCADNLGADCSAGWRDAAGVFEADIGIRPGVLSAHTSACAYLKARSLYPIERYAVHVTQLLGVLVLNADNSCDVGSVDAQIFNCNVIAYVAGRRARNGRAARSAHLNHRTGHARPSLQGRNERIIGPGAHSTDCRSA